MNNKFLKISTLGAYLTMVMVNALAVLLPLAGRKTGDISDSYPNLFAPAGYAFSIWSLIYILLGVYVVYQFRQSKKEVAFVNRLFIINALLNAAWIFAWHYEVIWLSVLLIIGLLITLIKIADVLRSAKLTPSEGWRLRLPFSVYFGWITVATIANITVFLVKIGWNRFGPSEVFWTVAILLVGALIGSWRMLKDRSLAYGLVLIWAYGAILYRHLAESGFKGEYPAVIVAAVIALLIFLGGLVFMSAKKKHKSLPN
ncbi:MAG: tryptophan-rich sensory protein [Candidatus Parcubacteria bacterium]|nr:MAG: hypothetical protein JST_5250 [Candidatus Parcubacteria bacterium]